MCTKLCRTCQFWGGSPHFDPLASRAKATCSRLIGWSFDLYFCDLWRQRPGQPLGTGILPVWYQNPENDWKAAASIIHDLRYDALKPGESTRAADDEWLTNCLLLAGSDKTKRAVAYAGYAIIRAYGVLRGLER